MDTQNKVLEEIANKVPVEVVADFDPIEFYKDREGLWVWNSFIERMVSKAEKVTAGAQFAVQSFKLTKVSNDETIENELPKDHTFSETEVCCIIATLISRQPKGEDGTLENDGNWNLFYTPAFVVFVSWDAGFGCWSVYTWGRDGGEWFSGIRFFSPATDL